MQAYIFNKHIFFCSIVWLSLSYKTLCWASDDIDLIKYQTAYKEIVEDMNFNDSIVIVSPMISEMDWFYCLNDELKSFNDSIYNNIKDLSYGTYKTDYKSYYSSDTDIWFNSEWNADTKYILFFSNLIMNNNVLQIIVMPFPDYKKKNSVNLDDYGFTEAISYIFIFNRDAIIYKNKYKIIYD